MRAPGTPSPAPRPPDSSAGSEVPGPRMPDNNLAERQLRGIAVTRKNFLFFGSDTGGQRAAAIYT